MGHDAAMLLRHQTSCDAPLADVFSVSSDPAFRQSSAKARGVLSADATISPQGEGLSVRIDQVQPIDGKGSAR